MAMLRDSVLCSIELEPEELTHTAEQARNIDLTDRPAMAVLYQICAGLMMLVGPMLWAALIVLFVEAEFIPK